MTKKTGGAMPARSADHTHGKAGEARLIKHGEGAPIPMRIMGCIAHMDDL